MPRPSPEMYQEYEATAYFYDEGSTLSRKHLDLSRHGQHSAAVELVLVMQNPGASELVSADRLDDGRAPAKLDNTLKQIIRLLTVTGYDSARILNLSDIRAPNKDTFFRLVEQAKKEKYAHSIFAESRRNDLVEHLPLGVPVIFAWGVDPRARNLARQAIRVLDVDAPCGRKKAGSDWTYYHPWPRNGADQRKWIEVVASQIALYSR